MVKMTEEWTKKRRDGWEGEGEGEVCRGEGGSR